jgi:hypothetical protein
MTTNLKRLFTVTAGLVLTGVVGLSTPTWARDYDKTITRNDGTVVHKVKTTDQNGSGRTVVTKTKTVLHTNGTGTTSQTTNTK